MNNQPVHKQTFGFIFKQGPYKSRVFIAQYHFICDNPNCACADVVFLVEEMEEADVTYTFTIDLIKKDISQHFRKDTDPASLEFAAHFMAELPPARWQLISARLIPLS